MAGTNPVTYPQPTFRLTVDGKDITRTVQPRLVSLTLEKQRGEKADQLDLVLDDADGKLAVPRRGVAITLALGWSDASLVDQGSFDVDEVEHMGAPDTLHIRARSADLRGSLRNRVEQSWHNTTLGAIVQTIAKRNSLQPRVDATLASTTVAHEDQTNEGDIAFLTRLAKRFDAVCTVKAGRLLLLPINGTTTSAGAAPTALTLTRSQGDQHRWHVADRDAYTGVRAYWHDPHRAKQRSVLVGQSGNAKRLREGHATEADARAAAEAEWQRIQRGAATFELTLARGIASVDVQQPLTVQGFKADIDGADWLVAKVTHSLGDGGFTTRLEAELFGADSSAGQAQDVGPGDSED